MNATLAQPASATDDSGLELALDSVSSDLPASTPAVIHEEGRAVVKMGIDRMNDLEFLDYVRNHLRMTEDNPELPDPQPPQETMEEDVEALNESVREVQSLMTALKAALLVKKTRRAKLMNRMRARAAYVQSASKGRGSVILGSGLGVRKARGKVSTLEAPGNLRAAPTVNAGQMRIACQGVRHGRVYELQYRRVEAEVEAAAAVAKSWQTLESGTRTRWLVNLEPGVKYAFRVCAIGSPGRSNWSPTVIRGAA